MKTLLIQCDDTVLFHGQVDEVNWTDGPNGVSVAGKTRKKGAGGSPAGINAASIFEKLAAARKQQTEQAAQAAREELSDETPAEILQ